MFKKIKRPLTDISKDEAVIKKVPSNATTPNVTEPIKSKPLSLDQLPSNTTVSTMGSYGDKKKTKKRLDEAFDF